MFALSFTKFKRAFTIIEFLIVFGIIGIVTTLSIASYNTFTESNKLKDEVQNAVSVLSLAQKRATTGEDCGSSCTFDSFKVAFTGSAGYTMQGQSDVAGVKTPYGTAVTYAIDAVNSNIVILDNTKSVTFNKLTGAPNSADTIRFKNNLAIKCTQISITATGLISTSNITCP